MAKTAAADNPRAKLLAEANRIQRAQGTAVRQTLNKAIGDLGKTGPKILKDPEALERLVSLIQTRQTLNGLAGGPPSSGDAEKTKSAPASPKGSKTRSPRR